MASKRLLTFSSDNRWRKQIDGVVRYFGSGRSKTDVRSYKEAERRYLDFLAQREKTKTVEVRANSLTIEDAAEAYLQFLYKRVQVEKKLTPSSWARSRTAINVFVGRFERSKLMGSLCELDLDEVRTKTLAMRRRIGKAEVITPATAKSHLATIRHFIDWSYRRFLIERLPRNLSEFSTVSLPPPNVKTFSSDELKTLWNAASSRTRLYMALAVNCGFGQTDISSLTRGEWNEATGVIKHKRSKTSIEGRYRLWPVTTALLKQHARVTSNADDSLLIGTNEMPLVHLELAEDKLKKTDAVRSAFSRVQNKTGINGGRGFYTLRKTAASQIERINPLLTGMFLAHSPREMKKHYALPHWEALDSAIAEMGRVFGVDSWPINEHEASESD